ncbi:MAG: glycosyltransferase family 4 protein [Chloroflexi bacterium]|nr:glycosyltransferase family 4 protein [Chloroflexota bacterium]
MYIVMLAPRFHPFSGGVERHVRATCRVLQGLGHSTTVITPRLDTSPPYENLEGIDIHRAPAYRRPKVRVIQTGLWVWQHRCQLRSADLFHFHDSEVYRLFSLPLRLLFPATPFYATFHGYEGFPIPPRAVKLRQSMARSVRGSIGIGGGNLYDRWYGTHLTTLIPGGVEVPTQTYSGEPIYDAVFVGRLAEDMGIREYVKALIVLKQRYGLVLTLQVCGDGPLRSEIAELATANGLNVTLNGNVARPEEFLDPARLAFVPGYMSILEATIRRKPVFAVYSDPFRKDALELLPAAGEMFICGSAEELAQAVAGYLANPDVIDVDRAYAWASQQTWEDVARTYLSLYEGAGR